MAAWLLRCGDAERKLLHFGFGSMIDGFGEMDRVICLPERISYNESIVVFASGAAAIEFNRAGFTESGRWHYSTASKVIPSQRVVEELNDIGLCNHIIEGDFVIGLVDKAFVDLGQTFAPLCFNLSC